MAKKFKKSTKSALNILLVILALSLFLFGVVIFKTNNGNPDVKGDSTPSSMPMIKRDGVAGEACGKSINRACQKNLICAPLGSSYRILATKVSAVESTTESETASSEETVNIGKTEDEIKDGRPPYIPYYGACVKKGVWPPKPIVSTPTPTPSSGCIPKPACVDGVVDPKTGAKLYCDPKPGTIFCTPTPTPSSKECYKRPVQLPCVIGKPCPMPVPPPPGAILCTPTPTPSKLSPTPTPTPSDQVTCVWCGLNCVDKSTVQACAYIAPPQGYLCVNQNNVCTKVAGVVVTPPRPPVQRVINAVRGWFMNSREVSE